MKEYEHKDKEIYTNSKRTSRTFIQHSTKKIWKETPKMLTKTQTLRQHIIQLLPQNTLNLLNPFPNLPLNILVLILHKLTNIRQHLRQKRQPLLAQLLRERLLGLQRRNARVRVIPAGRLGVEAGRGTQEFHERGVEFFVVVGGVGGDAEFGDGGDGFGDYGGCCGGGGGVG